MINSTFFRIHNHYLKNNSYKIVSPQIINLDLWFEDFVVNELVIIKEEILKIEDDDLRDLCLVALSAIIVNVSNQDSDTRYVRVIKQLKHKDVLEKYMRQLKKIRKLMLWSYMEIKKGQTLVKVADSREMDIFPEDSADLCVTSPPYPNAYDYHLYHKYRLFWLDMNPYHLRRNEIGAHADSRN